jgi:hypothetical protein
MWIEPTSQQRLLQCCYLLECQQAILLARSRSLSFIRKSEPDLPFPAQPSLWNANSPSAWVLAVQQCVNMPRYICEITTTATSTLNTSLFDIFQSSLISLTDTISSMATLFSLLTLAHRILFNLNMSTFLVAHL